MSDVYSRPGDGVNVANDFFNRSHAIGAAAAAAATAIINATALPASAATWVAGGAGFTNGALTASTYSSSTNQKLPKANAAYKGSSAWKLDVPRTLQYVCSAAQSGNVTTTGIDRYGNTVTETVTLNGATPVRGTVAFEYVISFAVPAKAGSETISIGTDTKLGLNSKPAFSLAVIEVWTATDGTADSGKGTLDVTNATLDPTTAPDGTNNYTVFYYALT